ncbi:concanavalin A-like lectin/glucanase domain-containing protein [Xylariaceae sp. FL0804]|nr:concanavalin A-like lectin/glucanase domain-containing protein [Xylariaceae sp. FL0804]
MGINIGRSRRPQRPTSSFTKQPASTAKSPRAKARATDRLTPIFRRSRNLQPTTTMPSLTRLLLTTLLSGAACALAAPAGTGTESSYPKSPAFLEQVRAAIHNATTTATAAGGATPVLDKRATTTFSSSQDGTDAAGFYYSMYNANGAGATYTEYGDSGEFALGWTTDVEFLAGKGYYGSTPQTLTWTGYFDATGDYTLAVYGWTTDPVTEWYIVEQYGTGTPGNGDVLGTVTSDGGTYDVYDLYYTDVTEIYGATSFHQYWSVRQSSRTTGTVTTGNHFQGWKDLGLDPGYTVFQMVTAEGFSGTGYLDFTVSY